MIESIFVHGWVVLVGWLGIIALVLMAGGIMLCMVKLDHAVKHGAAILCIVIVLILAPAILVGAWSGISLGQRIALAVIGVGILCWRRSER